MLVYIHKFWIFHEKSKKMIEILTHLRYNIYVILAECGHHLAVPGKRGFFYGKKDRNHFQRHSLPHHP